MMLMMIMIFEVVLITTSNYIVNFILRALKSTYNVIEFVVIHLKRKYNELLKVEDEEAEEEKQRVLKLICGLPL